MENINIGIELKDRKEIGDGLNHLLADSYTLYLLTHNFHWNVTGPRFRDLHMMFEEQYTELAEAIDEIAERIRSLGLSAPGTYKAFESLTAIESLEGVPSAETMVEALVNAHETVVRTCRTVLKKAQDADDESTASLVGDRMRVHEKTAWMLRSMAA
ncbi:MAG: Dps family protein [Alphaproteobacteria bacterium]